MKTSDFLAAGLLFEVSDIWYWITHSWVCRNTKDWSRIKFPLEEAAAKEYLTIVDNVEIDPSLPAEWLAEQAQKYNIACVVYDNFRHTLIARALRDVGFDAEKDGNNNIKLIRPSDIMKTAPLINSQFENRELSGETIR